MRLVIEARLYGRCAQGEANDGSDSHSSRPGQHVRPLHGRQQPLYGRSIASSR